MRISTSSAGKSAEFYVAELLCSKGYEIIGTNVRCGRHEIDIVALKRDTIVFCEVRSRAHSAICKPYETVGIAKIRRIREAARAWLTRKREQGHRMPFVRFDVASVTGAGSSRHIDYFEDAF